LHTRSRPFGRPPLPLILVVEDDAEVLEIVVEFLRSLGHEVLSAASGEQARGFLASRGVDLVVTDCLMSGEPGLSLAGYSAGLGIPVILTTGDPHHLNTLAASPLPMLPKPFRLGDLELLVTRSLTRPAD
jgi:DNA-binding NtrC family response regulator